MIPLLDRVRALGQRTPLAVQGLLLVSVVILLVWNLLAEHQRQQLRTLFGQELQRELERQSHEDRQLFDRRVQSVHQAATLLSSLEGFREHVASRAWQDDSAGAIRHHVRLPPWLPGASVMRSFFTAEHAVLIDPDGEIREIYHHVPHEGGDDIGPGLRNSKGLLRKLSHNQSYMTRVDGRPAILATEPVRDDAGRLLATLMLHAPLDERFLSRAAGLFRSDNIMALVDAAGERVVASSRPEALPADTRLTDLTDRYRMIGKSFFDYGASDLDLQFASFVPTERADRLTASVLSKNNRQRALLAAVLVTSFGLLLGWIAWRLNRFTAQVGSEVRRRLGLPLHGVARGDEIRVLDGRFNQMLDEIVDGRDALRREAEERVAAERRAFNAEQRRRELQLVKSLTATLGVGILLEEGDGQARPFNGLMEEYAAACGGAGAFLAGPDEPETERTLVDTSGARRIFHITRHETLGQNAWLVHEVTADRMAERERQVLASFPAANPNPVLRIGREGAVQYANPAAAALLEAAGGAVGAPVPGCWRPELEAVLEGSIHELEVREGAQTFAFVPGFIEGADFIYLYGRDVSDRKRAEREQRLAAAITHHVLDGILVTDVTGRIESVNPAFTRITGFQREEVVGCRPNVMKSESHGAEFYRSLWETLLQEGEWQGEIWNRRRDGEVFPVLSRISAIRDADGAITNFVSVFTDISERKAYEERLTQMAYHDALTGLPNRVLFRDRLAQQVAVATRRDRPFALLYLDLDGFKAVNDRHGHAAGDQLLMCVAERLRAITRDSDTVARLSGDEFALLLDDARDRQAVDEVRRKVCNALEAPLALGGKTLSIGASIGSALFPGDGRDAEELLLRADQDMYRFKKARPDRSTRARR
ncbi:MAG TPA: diguanylate cyclase [Gammaproteobacteria bacterium]|nr:diguanylate cyclase [Gammaproteobacteria bacterium]